MSKHTPGSLTQRLEDQAKAKQAMLEAFRARPTAAEQARDARMAARRAERLAEIERQKEERKAKAEARAAALREQSQRKPMTRSRVASILAGHQAARDARKAQHQR